MNSTAFGELTFNTGWKTETSITLFDNTYNIVVKAKAYFEKDGVTAEQEKAYFNFNGNRETHLVTVEKLLNQYTNGKAATRFIPRTMLFQRDGGYALLLDDNEDEDAGIAVTFAPKAEVVSQDEYL